MRRVETSGIRKILVAGAGVDGRHLRGFRRPSVGATFLPAYRAAPALAVSRSYNRNGLAGSVACPQMCTPERVRDSGIVALAGITGEVRIKINRVVVAVGTEDLVACGALRGE